MAYFKPTPLEHSLFEQIEATFMDDSITGEQRTEWLIEYWIRLEHAHKSAVTDIVLPNGHLVERPSRLYDRD